MSELNDRELATILAALRKWQGSIRVPEAGQTRPGDAELGSIAANDGSFPPLTPVEIDELCEKLNS